MINGNTKIVGVIGHPIKHSFSPPMHNAAFRKLKLDWTYVPFDVNPLNLKSAILGAKSLNILGFNVTIPHKIDVIQYLEKLDPIAKSIGAVNTIDFKEMKGYNTDGIGCIRTIEEVTSIKDKNVVVAGAGGAARAISFYLDSKNPQSINILNRDVKKAKVLASEIKANYDSIDKIATYINDADILIDTTPLGMSSHVNDTPILTSKDMHSDLVVNDIVYNPNETVLLREAIKAGATPVYGIKMLLYQGAESFKIWTGEDAPIDVMEKTLKKTLNLGD